MISPKKFERLYRALDLSRSVLIVVLLGFVILAGATDIFLRYVTRLGSFTWTDEILRYLNIWIVFLGAGVGVKRGVHMNVEFFLQKCFKEETVRLIRKIVLLTILLCFSILLIGGIQEVIKFRDVQIQARAISIAWFYLAIPVGCLLMFLDYFLILVYGEHPSRNLSKDQKG